MKCPKCNKEMKNLGNVGGMVFLTYPVQWDDTYVCDSCKIKEKIGNRGEMPPDYSYLEDYKSFTPSHEDKKKV
jgi:hypothetical protein